MNIFFATTSLPHEQSTGGEIASQAFVKAMRTAGHFVQVFGFARGEGTVPPGSTRVAIRAVESASAGPEKFLWLGRSLCTGRPFICEKFRSARYLNCLYAAARLGKADVLVIDHAQMGWLLPMARQFARSIVLIAHNHEAALYAAEAARHAHLFKKGMLQRDSVLVNALEHKLAQAAQQVWALSGSEQAAFAAMTEPSKVALLPLAGRSMPSRAAGKPTRFNIGLLGTWSWDVNGQGLRWFVEQVLPLLPCDVQVRVAGRGSEHVNDRQANLVGLGFIDDPVEFMHKARVLVVPSVAGAGIQLKTIEAIASGTPIVSTTLGVRGLGNLPGFVAVEDEPAAFASALLQQMKMPAPVPGLAQAWTRDRQDLFEREVASQLARLDASPILSAARATEPA